MDSRRIFCRSFGIALLASCLAIVDVYGQSRTVIYVRETRMGTRNGNSWGTAYPILTDAFHRARNNPGTLFDIYVAGSPLTYSYNSDGDGSNIRRTSGDARSASFQMMSNMRIYGGFDDSNPEATPAARTRGSRTRIDADADNGVTTLYNVFFVASGVKGAVIDGFEIFDARANHSSTTN